GRGARTSGGGSEKMAWLRAGAKAEIATPERYDGCSGSAAGGSGAAGISGADACATPRVYGRPCGNGTLLRNAGEGSLICGTNGLAAATITSDGAGAGTPSRKVANSKWSSEPSRGAVPTY